MGIMMVYHLILFHRRNAWVFPSRLLYGGWTLAIMALNGTFIDGPPNEPLLMAGHTGHLTLDCIYVRLYSGF